VYFLTGRAERADELLDRVLSTPRGGRASLLVARRALLLRARIRLAASELAEAREMLEAVRPYVRSASLLRPFVMELESQLRFAAGDMAGLDGDLASAKREANKVDRACAMRLQILAERLATARADVPERLRPTGALVSGPSALANELLTLRTNRLLRHSGTVDPGIPAELDSADLHAGEVAVHSLRAARAMLSGDSRVAIDEALRSVRSADRCHDRLAEIEAMLVLGDALLIAGDDRELGKLAQELADRARWTGSSRYRAEAAFLAAWGDVAVMERLAAQEDAAPSAARRSQALLGGMPPLDRLDDRVINAIRTRRPSYRLETVGATGSGVAWQPGWGLDEIDKRVWMQDGRALDLSGRAVLWKLLSFLFDRGGAATKEEMVVAVWEEKSYHPGRHDPKLHMTVRKLREMLEDDPSNPTRLVTTEGGYGLGGLVRRQCRAD
jgi:hypothetical protein